MENDIILKDVKVGDKVRSCLAGWGEVALLIKDHFVVNFGPNKIKHFNYEGKNMPWDENPEIVEVEKKKTWKPEGGPHLICGNGHISFTHYPEDGDFVQEGRAYKTKEMAEKAYSLIRPYQRLVAYVLECVPDYDHNKYEYLIYYDKIDKKYTTLREDSSKVPCELYMPKDVAENLAEKLNNGEIEL